MAQHKTRPEALNILVTIPTRVLAEVICSACESGSCYWASFVERSHFPVEGVESAMVQYYQPFEPGGRIVFHEVPDNGRKIRRHLTLSRITRGLRLMAQHSPKWFGEILANGYDAETADLFLQYCLLGEIRYQ